MAEGVGCLWSTAYIADGAGIVFMGWRTIVLISFAAVPHGHLSHWLKLLRPVLLIAFTVGFAWDLNFFTPLPSWSMVVSAQGVIAAWRDNFWRAFEARSRVFCSIRGSRTLGGFNNTHSFIVKQDRFFKLSLSMEDYAKKLLANCKSVVKIPKDPLCAYRLNF